MQVKKFEASSMKEALELVKTQLGPEAIILSVKDRKNPAARGGGQIFEVTAAVSETTLRKKIAAEKKLGARELEKFGRSSARVQKEFINKVFEQPVRQPYEKPEPRPLTARRYIDIDDSGEFTAQSASDARAVGETRAAVVAAPVVPRVSAQERIKSAAESARMAAMNGLLPRRQAVQEEAPRVLAATVPAAEPRELLTLKNEIGQLKKVIEELQGVKTTRTNLHPGAESGIHFVLSTTYEKLLRAGLDKQWVTETLIKAQTELPRAQAENKSVVEGFVAKKILEGTEIVKAPLASRYHVFVGPSGQGKTSSLVKLASHLVLNAKKRVAIATVDRFKVGASDQLRTFAQILNIPYAEVSRKDDWNVIDQKLGHIDFILVDFPGASLLTTQEVEILQDLLPPTTGGRAVHLVQSVLTKDEDAYETAQRYSPLGIKDVIFTKLDESIQHGLIFNFQNRFKWPLFSFGIGPQIPEDFEWAGKERVLNLIFRISKIKNQSSSQNDLEDNQS